MTSKSIEQGSGRLKLLKASTDQLEATKSQPHSPEFEPDLPICGALCGQQAINVADPANLPLLPALGQSVGSANSAGAQQESGIAPSEKVG